MYAEGSIHPHASSDRIMPRSNKQRFLNGVFSARCPQSSCKEPALPESSLEIHAVLFGCSPREKSDLCGSYCAIALFSQKRPPTSERRCQFVNSMFQSLLTLGQVGWKIIALGSQSFGFPPPWFCLLLLTGLHQELQNKEKRRQI